MSGSFRLVLTAGAIALCLAACTPRFDWREVRGTEAPYTVLMPAKPASHARPINLGGTQVVMTMTAAEVDGALFAVGTAVMPDAAAAGNALAAMKTALINNIGGTLKSEKAVAAAGTATLELEAVGGGPQPRLLFARLAASGTRVYQVVALGPEKALPREAVDTFLTSFQLK
ncbi:MAG TPA: hypothetical protein VEC06_04135 [Paucimonas sp.]|nr:hypothetical protein [Paucimonas sp.]